MEETKPGDLFIQIDSNSTSNLIFSYSGQSRFTNLSILKTTLERLVKNYYLHIKLNNTSENREVVFQNFDNSAKQVEFTGGYKFLSTSYFDVQAYRVQSSEILYFQKSGFLYLVISILVYFGLLIFFTLLYLR